MTATELNDPSPVAIDPWVGNRAIRQMFDVSERQVMRWQKDPAFPRKIKIGKLTRFRLSEVVAWVEAQQQAR